jgi:carboxypeptidase PM20D1
MPASPLVPPVALRAGSGSRLAELIRLRTVSAHRGSGGASEVSSAFAAFPRLLADLYPLVHQRLERETVDGTGLLFRWRGDAAQDPLVLMAHWDVVPAVEDWAAAGWSTDPFAGTETTVDGADAVRGRGALDDKGPLVVILEAVENLLAAGFTPARDVWLLLGGDEEVMGSNAHAMSALFKDRLRTELQDSGAEPWLVLDEGGAVVPRPLSFVDGTCALIGLAEKGQAHVRLVASGTGGHASSPPEGSPVPRLARALGRLERRPFSPGLNGTTSAMLAALAPLTSGAVSRALPVAARTGTMAARALAALGGEPAALVRTTVAATRLQAGTAVNVLPSSATATLDCRIAPGETVAQVVDRIRRRVADDQVSVELVSGHDPSPESPTDGEQFAALGAAVGTSWPGVTPVPYLLMAATDSRHFHSWCRHVYRFAPLQMDQGQRAAIHGADEWVSVESLERGEAFHRALVTARGGHFGTGPARG